MKMIKLPVFFLIAMLIVLGGCSKSSPPAPAPQTPKKAASPVVPATPPKMVTSMATSSSIKGTSSPGSLKPAVAVTTGVAAPTAASKMAPSSIVPMPGVALTSTTTTTPPAKPLDFSPVYSYNPEGKKDPFMTFLQGATPAKGVKTSIPLLNYSLGDLKLVAVMVIKKHKFLAMVQTPDLKGYVVKPGMEIGIHHGKIREITDHSISVEEEFTEIGGEKRKRTVVLSLRPPEEGQL